MTMTGCSTAPTDDALYLDGEDRYVAYSSSMHEVIMAIDESEWFVAGATFGASPIPCRIGGEISGYQFSWTRTLEPEVLDTDRVVAAATAAFEEVGMDAQTATYGEGERQEINVIGTGGDVGRGVVTMRADRNTIRVSATTACTPGDAGALSDMVFDGLVYEGASKRFPEPTEIPLAPYAR
ncbi:MAG: hypothetical protein ACTH2E_01870 [Microbacterium sp.]